MFKREKHQINLVMCFDKNAEAVCWTQTELVGNVLDEIPDLGACLDLKYLKRDERNHLCYCRNTWPAFVLSLQTRGLCAYLLCVVGEADFVENLGAVQLDGV